MTTYANRTLEYGLLPVGPVYKFTLSTSAAQTGYVPGATETIAVTKGSTTVAGTNTSFATSDKGYALKIDNMLHNVYYVVDVSGQNLTLDRPWQYESESGIAYTRWELCLHPFTKYLMAGSAGYTALGGDNTVTATADSFPFAQDELYTIYTGNTDDALFWSFYASSASVYLQRLKSS